MNRVGAPWTQQEDQLLMKKCTENISIQEISKIHQRNVGGIKSRIRKNTFELYPGKTDLEISEIVGIPVTYLEQCQGNKRPQKIDTSSLILEQLKIISGKLDLKE